MGATLAILELMSITKGMTDGKLVAGLKSQLEVWGPLLKRLSIGVEEEKAIIVALENAAIGGGDIGEVLSTGRSFRFVLQTLHDEEIISEETVLGWASERRKELAREGEDNARAQLFQLPPVQDFLEWLEEESDEDASGDEEESDEE
jgi:translation initiation factor eIF-2B subunit epsilon